MSVIITSTYPISLVAGSGVRSDAPAVPEVTTDDIYDPRHPTRRLTDLLAGPVGVEMVGAAIVDGTVAQTTAIYTVSAGQFFIPTAITFTLRSIAGSGDTPAISVGFTGDFRDLVDSTRTTTFMLAGGTILDDGYDYLPGDLIDLNWGVYTAQSVLAVDAVNSIGAVSAYHIEVAGSYRSVPANPITTTSSRTSLYGKSLYDEGPYGGGHGSGFMLEGQWDEATGPFVGIDKVGQIVSFKDFTATGRRLGRDYKYLTAGQTLTVSVDDVATYSTYRLQCLVFGLLVEAMPTPTTFSIKFYGKDLYGLGGFGRDPV